LSDRIDDSFAQEEASRTKTARCHQACPFTPRTEKMALCIAVVLLVGSTRAYLSRHPRLARPSLSRPFRCSSRRTSHEYRQGGQNRSASARARGPGTNPAGSDPGAQLLTRRLVFVRLARTRPERCRTESLLSLASQGRLASHAEAQRIVAPEPESTEAQGSQEIPRGPGPSAAGRRESCWSVPPAPHSRPCRPGCPCRAVAFAGSWGLPPWIPPPGARRCRRHADL